MEHLTPDRAEEILDSSKGRKIAVIGDVMLDRYFWGSVTRISPESPVPVVDVDDETFHLGGAANVANNLHSLGLVPLLCGILGRDNSGEMFRNIAETNSLDTSGLYIDENRPTTVKTRIIGNNQQLIRLDREKRDMIPSAGIDHICNTINSEKELAGIIFEDYNKGVINSELIERVNLYAENMGIPVFVDPKFDNFFDFKNVTVFKPNKKEAAQALMQKIENADDVITAGKILLEKLNCKFVLLTLGKDGMMLFEAGGNISSVPTRARHVADVSGAGDTAIATLAAMFSSGASIGEAAAMANFASGVVCEMPGIVSITPDALINSVRKNNVK